MRKNVCLALILAALCLTPLTGLPAALAQAADIPVEAECVWTLTIDDTQTAEVNGYMLTCTLTVLALKPSGTDELGVYTGAAHIAYQYQMAQGSFSASASGEGQDLYAAIEIVPYQSDAYDTAAATPGVTELVTYDAMALGEFLLSGSGSAEETSGGASWSKADSAVIPAAYRLAVDGRQVSLELYTIAPGLRFTGMITGEPI